LKEFVTKEQSTKKVFPPGMSSLSPGLFFTFTFGPD